MTMKEKWERPNCPTGELQKILGTAEKVRAIEHAPAISVTHFFVAMILISEPYRAKRILELLKKIKKDWEKDLE